MGAGSEGGQGGHGLPDFADIEKRTEVEIDYLLIMLERTYKPHYHYQNFSPLANGTDLNREKYAILQTH